MLQELSIQNLALIEKLHLNFNNGFSTLTGETGAGKSILLDALGLALGDRSDSSLVRHNTSRADVTAQFDIGNLPHVQDWLNQQELEDDNACYLRRTVTSEGRSKAYINNRPIPASMLKVLGNMLIDIHGQHEHQSLLSNHKQLELLDAYAGHPKQVEKTKQSYQVWLNLNQQLISCLANQADNQSKLELLNFQNAEFEEVMPVEGEFKTLSEAQNQLSHATKIKQVCETVYDTLEGETSVADLINQAILSLNLIVNVSPVLQVSINQLNSALIEVQETAGEVQQHANATDVDPKQLNHVEERLSLLFSLAKKYNQEPDALVTKQQQLRTDLTSLIQTDGSLEDIRIEIEQAWSNYKKRANSLSHSRITAAQKLSNIITEGMHNLGMPSGLFAVSMAMLGTPNASGLDKVVFQVTANKGQPIQPLAKVASGGELSRINLAIQVATAEVASLPTLIFDEVDVGIGGAIAEVVGKKMRQLGLHKQILSITHLAQVASHGHTHLHIQKHTQNEQTYTQVIELNENARIKELARMMGGLTITEQTISHAKEIFISAQR